MNQERVDAIIGENELTRDFLQTLKLEDLRLLGTELFELDENPVDSIEDLRIKLETLVLFSLVKRKADAKGKKPVKYKVVLTVIDKLVRAEAEMKKAKEEANADTAE